MEAEELNAMPELDYCKMELAYAKKQLAYWEERLAELS